GRSSFDARVNRMLVPSNAQVGRVQVPCAQVRVGGGPNYYRLQGDFGDQGNVKFTLARAESRYDLDGEAHVVVDRRNERLHLWLHDLRYGPERKLALRAAQLSYRGARAQLEGRYALNTRRAELTAHVQAPNL